MSSQHAILTFLNLAIDWRILVWILNTLVQTDQK